MKSHFPDLNQLLESLGQPPWCEPEARANASVRALGALAKQSATQWAKTHWRVRAWYDRCRKQLLKSGEVFFYPELQSIAAGPQRFFQKLLERDLIMNRVAVLYLTDYRLTADQIFDILRQEGRSPQRTSLRLAVAAMQSLVAALAKSGQLDIEKVYEVLKDD